MSNIKLKAFSCLLIFLMLDIAVPTHFFLNTEFLMLGIILLSFHISFGYALFLGTIFGAVKDSLMFNNMPISTLNFILTVILINYLKRNFRGRVAFQFIIVFVAIILNLIVNSIAEEKFSLIFSFSFVIQSFIAFIFIRLLLKRWIHE